MKGTVIAFGSFDLLHPGHLKYLEEARKLGSRLVVVVARDETIMLLKKIKPIMTQYDRALLVSSLKMVDEATVGRRIRSKSDLYNIFLEYKPDVIALGYDQSVDMPEMKKWLAKHKMKTKIIRLNTRLDGPQYKSSKIKERIRSSS